MNISLSKYAGFCPGVKKADNTVKTVINKGGYRIFTLGHLIHNRIYNEELERLGVRSIEFEEINQTYFSDPTTPMLLIIRTHGITKDKLEYIKSFKLQNNFFDYIDATCSFVKNIHRIAEENTDDSTVFLLFCDPNHPEAIGTLSYAKGEKYAFSSLEELQTINFDGKTPILCAQTTQNLLEWKKSQEILKKLYTLKIDRMRQLKLPRIQM